MVLTELTGLLAIAVGPTLIWAVPTPAEWEADSERAREERRAYAGRSAFFLSLSGVALVALGLLGYGP